MKELDDRLKDNATEAEITAAVEALCNYLPGSLKAQVLCFTILDLGVYPMGSIVIALVHPLFIPSISLLVRL